MRRPKGNILVIVLFVMIVSSLLGLLASQYVTTLSQLTGLFKNYYTSYYYAYGGVEFALAQVRAHGYGFQDEHTLLYPTKCGSAKCTAQTSIVSRSLLVDAGGYKAGTECTPEHMLPLGEGESLIIPLYRDESVGFDEIKYHIMTVQEFMQQTPIVYTQGENGQAYNVRIIDENVTFYATVAQGKVGTPLTLSEQQDLRVTEDSITNKKYLIISNPVSTKIDVCLALTSPTASLPLPIVTISSKGTYGSTQVALGASKVVQLPSYLVFGTISN